MAYVPIKFPSMRFHRTESARIVDTAEEAAALGPGWAESPAFAEDEPSLGEDPERIVEVEPAPKPRKRGKTK